MSRVMMGALRGLYREVHVGPPLSGEQLLEDVRAEWYDVIGFSVSCDSRLDHLKREIRRVRQASKNRKVAILAGGRAFNEHPGLLERIGADASAANAELAPECARQVLASLPGACCRNFSYQRYQHRYLFRLERATMSHGSKPLTLESIPNTGLDRDSAIALIAAAGDIALVVDQRGVILEVSTSDSDNGIGQDSAGWVGRPWVETVTVESRGKVEALLRDVATSGVSRRRQVNHPTDSGPDIPVAYTAVRLTGAAGTVLGLVAVGRDMRAIASLQQRLVETQQALERDYWRLRHVETRYRLLFQVSSEAILVVDASNRRIVDANDAAGRLFDKATDKLVGRTFPIGVDSEWEPALEEALANARTAGRSGTIEAKLTSSGVAVDVSVSCFRQESVSLFLVRFTAKGTLAAHGSELGAEVTELIANAPDGFVVTDIEGRVVSANRAFLDHVQLAGEQQAQGRLLSEWIGRPGADLGVFLATLRKHGAIRIMATAVRGEQGGTSEAEISAAAAASGSPQFIGFILRDVGRRVAHGPQGARDLTLAVEQLTSLVGRVALRDLLRDTSDLVERHFIEAALELTEDNRTAAAGVLGLSRQSLYVKMRRHQLAAGIDHETRRTG